MAAVVYLNRDQVDECIKSIEGILTQLSESASDMDKIITQQLPEAWQGDAAEKTQEIYTENYRPLLTTNLPDALRELSTFIDSCKTAIIQTDEQLAGGAQ